ncbi:MAG: hypothetical protein H0U95_10735 [Bacteroidetes bacterium]|nr:hypothetical protein [Bacteroidota bacterium]
MNSALASIGKNLLLIVIVVLSAFNFFYSWFNWTELLEIQLIFGLAYIFLSCYEVLNASYKAALPVQRFSYFTFSLVALRILKVGVFVTFALMLYTSGSRAKYLYVICLIIALTELIVLFIKYKKGLCFISIYANYLLFAESRLKKIFASEIEIIEFRHEIFYFVKKDKKTFEIKLIHISDKTNFLVTINEWINRNNAPVSKESKEKISKALN